MYLYKQLNRAKTNENNNSVIYNLWVQWKPSKPATFGPEPIPDNDLAIQSNNPLVTLEYTCVIFFSLPKSGHEDEIENVIKWEAIKIKDINGEIKQ